MTTGDIEDYPGIDSLARYTVKIKGEDIIVSASKKVIISIHLQAYMHVYMYTHCCIIINTFYQHT